MRALAFLVAVFVFGLTPCPVRPASAQTVEQAESAIREFAAWAQAMNAISTDMVALYQSSDALNALVDAYLAGEKDEATVVAGIEEWRRGYSANIEALRVRNNAVTPPRFSAGFDALQTAVDATTLRMRQTFDQSEAFAAGMADISLRSVRGELDGQAGAVQRAFALARQLVDFENGSLAIRKAVSPEDHPNRPLADANIALNNSMLIVFEALVESEPSVFNDDQRARLRASAVEVRRHVVAAREASAQTRARIDSAMNAFSPEMRAGIDRMFVSLGATFETLNGAADMLEAASRAQSDSKDAYLLDLLGRFETLALEIARQDHERAAMLQTTQPTL